MTLEELMLKRRSVRKYKDTPVPDELIDKLLHYGMSGPSACNRCPWEFYVVTNKDILDKINLFAKSSALPLSLPERTTTLSPVLTCIFVLMFFPPFAFTQEFTV